MSNATNATNPTPAPIAGLTDEQAAHVTAQGARARYTKLATAKRSERFATEFPEFGQEPDPTPAAPAPAPAPSAAAEVLAELLADQPTDDTPIAQEVTIDLDNAPGQEAPESYLARLMGEPTIDLVGPTTPARVGRLRSGVAAANGHARGEAGVNGHAMVRRGMTWGSPTHDNLARSLYAGGWAVGETVYTQATTGHPSRIWEAAPLVEGRKVIAEPAAQRAEGKPMSVVTAWLYPAQQAGMLESVGRGAFRLAPGIFDVLTAGIMADLADVRAANRAKHGMGPDPMAVEDDPAAV